MCYELHELDPAQLFFTAPGLAWPAALKKIKVRLDLLTDINVINGRKRYQRRNVTLFIDIQKLKANI